MGRRIWQFSQGWLKIWGGRQGPDRQEELSDHQTSLRTSEGFGIWESGRDKTVVGWLGWVVLRSVGEFTRRMICDFFVGMFVSSVWISMMPFWFAQDNCWRKHAKVVLIFPFSECYELILNHFLVLPKLEHRLADRFSLRSVFPHVVQSFFFRNATGISDRVRQAPVSELLVLAARSLRTMVFLFPFFVGSFFIFGCLAEPKEPHRSLRQWIADMQQKRVWGWHGNGG